MPAFGRECGQAPLDPDPSREPVAEDGAGAGRVGGDAEEGGSYLQSQFRRLKGRRGPKKAIVAVAASMLTAAYFMLRDEKDYHDLGGRYLEDRDKHRIAQRLLRRLHDLGVEVEVKVA